MKKLFSILLPIIMLFAMTGCGDSSDKNNSKAETSSEQGYSAPAAEDKEGFKVDGTKLLDANGNEFVMRGINHAHCWYKSMTGVAVAAIANTGSNAIRLVISDGQQWEKSDIDELKELIEQCKERKLIAVLEVHDATGKDDEESLENAVNYWIEMKDALAGQEDYVILNIANEWFGSWRGEEWRDGYKKAIPKLRDAGIKNTLLIDSAGWGQYPQSVIDYGKEVFNTDELKNTMFAVHFYGSAGGTAEKIKTTLDSIREQGLCVCVGEFGFDHSDGDVDEDYIMKYCTEQNIGYMGWSWKGNGGGVEYLDLTDDWTGENLTKEWGEKLVNGENGIKKTSKICSVFEK